MPYMEKVGLLVPKQPHLLIHFLLELYFAFKS